MKILNAYAGIGGNRKLWEGVNVTAVENNPEIANVYADFYPNDNLIIADAHEYLLNNYDKYDFIWSSPPCQTHASFRQNICVRFRGSKPEYPDMKLYQEIIFLRHNFKGGWIIENVKPYYDVLIYPTAELHRHYFWTNFSLRKKDFQQSNLRSDQISQLQIYHGISLDGYKLQNKRQILRNCILPELGLYVLNSFLNKIEYKQTPMFG